MKRVNLVGEYEYLKPTPCSFEDIPVFLKMSDVQEKNPCLDELLVTVVDKYYGIFLNAPIVRWKIIKNQYGRYILAFRTFKSSYYKNIPNGKHKVYVYAVLPKNNNKLFLKRIS